MRHARIAVLLCSGLRIAAAVSDETPVIDRDAPRPYGYAIGDLIHHELTIVPGRTQVLDEGSVPKPGPLNRWLELRAVNVTQRSGGRIQLLLDYQVFYAPLTVKNLTIPGFSLRFTGPGGISSHEVQAWPFSIAPIHGLAVLDSGGLEPLRPDAMPEPLETRGHLLRVSAFLLLAAGSLAYLAHLRGILAFDRQGRHFREARRTLRRLRKEHESPEIMKTGFTAVHRAFDRSLGEPLFAERLPEFFLENARYAGLRNEIEGFFQASYRFFFGDSGSETDYGIDRLESLCAACLLAERNRR